MDDSRKRGGDNQTETIFHYSRERRLERASERVQSFNQGSYTRPSIRKTLFGTRGNIIMFLSIIVISVFGVAISYFTREPPPATAMTLGRNSLTLAILRVEETLILAIVKNAPSSGEFYTGDVDIAVIPAEPRINPAEAREEPRVFSHRVFFHPAATETFHIALPFEGDDFILVMRAGEEQRTIRLRVTDTD